MKKYIYYLFLLVISFAAGWFLTGKITGGETKTISRSKILLGTLVEIQVRTSDEDNAKLSISKAFDEIERIDSIFSVHNQQSYLSVINKKKTARKTDYPEIFELIKTSGEIYNLSHGAFNAAMNRLITLWKFNSDNPSLPSKEQIESTLHYCNWENVKFEEDVLHLLNETELNFNSIAKGYAVDRAVEILKRNNIADALVNAGGEVKSLGDYWKIGIQHPRDENKIIEKLSINEYAVATSGDYEKYFFVNGKRYHHILNPVTGYPAEGVISVTVINKSCTIADALSTAVFVMGVEKGLQLIDKLDNTEALIIDNQLNKYYSKNFKNFITN